MVTHNMDACKRGFVAKRKRAGINLAHRTYILCFSDIAAHKLRDLIVVFSSQVRFQRETTLKEVLRKTRTHNTHAYTQATTAHMYNTLKVTIGDTSRKEYDETTASNMLLPPLVYIRNHHPYSTQRQSAA